MNDWLLAILGGLIGGLIAALLFWVAAVIFEKLHG